MRLIDFIERKIGTARKKGLKWCIFCKGYSFILKHMQMIYGFDPWHSDNLTSCRPYKKYVAVLVSDLCPHKVVEIGCGLGDIISNIEAFEKFGIDPSQPAISAAKLLYPFSNTRWLVGDLSDLNQVSGHIDVLLAIGWVHEVSADYLENLISPHVNRISYILLDKFNYWQGSKYQHDFCFMNKFGKCVKDATPEDDSIRNYLLYKLGSN